MSIEIKDKRDGQLVKLGSLKAGAPFIYTREGGYNLYIVVNKKVSSGSVCCFHISSATIVDFFRDTYVNPVKVAVTIE